VVVWKVSRSCFPNWRNGRSEPAAASGLDAHYQHRLPRRVLLRAAVGRHGLRRRALHQDELPGKTAHAFREPQSTLRTRHPALRPANEFAHRIDGTWSDLLWPYHGGDHIVDDEFVSYISYITELCELREGRMGREPRLGPRARTVFGPDNSSSNATATTVIRSS
jgi:hypothetical protein